MLKRILSLTMCLAILSAAAVAFAEDVYVTANGKKYHKADCILIQERNPQKTTLDQALKKGLEPCKKCFNPEVKDAKAKKDKSAKAKDTADFTKEARAK